MLVTKLNKQIRKVWSSRDTPLGRLQDHINQGRPQSRPFCLAIILQGHPSVSLKSLNRPLRPHGDRGITPPIDIHDTQTSSFRRFPPFQAELVLLGSEADPMRAIPERKAERPASVPGLGKIGCGVAYVKFNRLAKYQRIAAWLRAILQFQVDH